MVRLKNELGNTSYALRQPAGNDGALIDMT